MKLLRLAERQPSAARRGVALLMAFLVLMVVLAICAQLRMSTASNQRTANNDMGLTRMDLAIESALQEAAEQLRTDADAAGSGGGDAGGTPDPAAAGGAAGAAAAAGGAGGEQQPVDSHEDVWGKPQRTEINRVELRVMFQDEDSKLNVLGMLAPDENESEKAYQRVVRILDSCRQGTTEDIDSSDAERMAAAMRDHLRRRALSVSPRTKLLSDDEENPDVGLPLTLKEFGTIEPFEPQHFRDYRDDHGEIVHSIGSFLTVHTALRTGDALVTPIGGAAAGGTTPAGAGGANAPATGNAGGNPASSNSNNGKNGSSGGNSSGNPQGGSGGSAQGGAGTQGQAGAGGGAASAPGIAVNVNTSPPCVLKALMEDRDIGGRFWDSVIEYRNLEEKQDEEQAEEDAEPTYDEYGREVIQRQVFDTIQELEQVPGAERLPGDPKAEVLRLLTTQSQVFSIFVTARIVTGRDTGRVDFESGPPPPGEREDELGNALTRTVRAVVWRVTSDDGTIIVPIVRWEVLDYLPFEVLDYPDDDR